MTLDANTLISHYRILSPIGKGGMGEVYRALDERLDRDVAIKMLPEDFSRDEDRLQRFELEARTTSALNHPNILTVYDIGEYEGAPFIVSELLDGRELRDRMDEGAISLHKAIDYARQIAGGLSAAHGKGIVHRDLKPENIFVTSDDRVKILDFGLAKLAAKTGASSGSEDATRKAITDPGMVMGTAGYMSPEQVRGDAVDHRSDIFSFGTILYEMLTGIRAFQSDTLPETMTAILKEEPEDLHSTSPGTNPALTKIVNRCLEKRPELRFQTTTDLAFALEALAETSGSSPTRTFDPAEMPKITRKHGIWRSQWFWPAFEVVWTALVIAFLLGFPYSGSLSRTPLVVFDVFPPGEAYPYIEKTPSIAISPDGETVVFAGVEGRDTFLFYRRRSGAETKKIEGTKDAELPAFSPDGKTIAFATNSQLKRVSIGEPVVPVADVSYIRSISWKDDSTIVFSPNLTSGLIEIPITGGESKTVTKLDAAKNERTHRYGQVLPGGKAMIFTVGTTENPDDYEDATIDGVFFETGERRQILKGASMARYSPTGHLVFARGGNLYAVAFDPVMLTAAGEPVPVLQGVAGDQSTGASQYAIAEDGTLAYIPGSIGANIIQVPAWMDSEGTPERLQMDPGFYNDLRISPDGKRCAYVVGQSGNGDIWTFDFERKTTTRLTFDSINGSPVWSADSNYIYYCRSSQTEPRTLIMRKRSDGTGDAEQMATVSRRSFLKAVEKGENSVLVEYSNGLGSLIARVRFGGNNEPELVVDSKFRNWEASLSPDGRWLAFTSNESGRPQVFVKDLGGTGGKWQVSRPDSYEANWSGDGRKLYYRTPELTVVDVTYSPTFSTGPPTRLFTPELQMRTNTGILYDISKTDGRILMFTPESHRAAPAGIRVAVNWTRELQRQLANRKGGK